MVLTLFGKCRTQVSSHPQFPTSSVFFFQGNNYGCPPLSLVSSEYPEKRAAYFSKLVSDVRLPSLCIWTLVPELQIEDQLWIIFILDITAGGESAKNWKDLLKTRNYLKWMHFSDACHFTHPTSIRITSNSYSNGSEPSQLWTWQFGSKNRQWKRKWMQKLACVRGMRTFPVIPSL